MEVHIAIRVQVLHIGSKTNGRRQRIVEGLALKHDGNVASNAKLYFKKH